MISPKIMELAAWAQERFLPTCFERAWETRTRRNPVTLAIRMIEADEKRKLRGERIMNSFAQFLLCVLAFGAFVGAANLLSSLDFWPWVFTALSSLFVIAAFVFLKRFMSARKMQTRSFELGDETEVLGFYADLENLRNWGRLSAVLSRFSEEKLGSIAEIIMVKAARLQLEMQKKIPEKAEKETELMLELGDATSEFHRRYGTLQRLGLVSGDFKKFYDKARRQMEQEQYH